MEDAVRANHKAGYKRSDMRWITPVLLTLALSACASPRKADLRLPEAFEAAQDEAAERAALDRWWLAFGDAELTLLIEQALAANPDARAAAARLSEVKAQRVNALAQFLPRGDATGSMRETKTDQLSGTQVNIPGFATSGTSENDAANFNVSWEVDLFGRVLAAKTAVDGDVAAARFALEGARASLAAQTADSYFQAKGLAIQLADAQATARIQRELYGVAETRAAAGLAAATEPDRVAGDLAQAEARAASLAAELQAQRRALLILTGRVSEPTESLAVSPTLAKPPKPPATLPSELLARRPDVREAEARIAASAGRGGIAVRALFPTFTLTPGLGWSRSVQPGFASESQSWTMGVAASQPVLSIPRLLADIKAQNARTEQAVLGYEKAVRTAFAEAEGALVRLDADTRGAAMLRDGAERAERAYRASAARYANGLVDLQTALSAEQAWRATRSQLTSAEVQALRRTVQTYKALGGGWSPPATRQAMR
jgi:outer membrane protein, multidrug efflux system